MKSFPMFCRGLTLTTWIVPFVLFTVLDGFVMFTDLRWIGEYGWAMEWANAGLYLSGTFLAAVSCFASRSYFSEGFKKVTQIQTLTEHARLFISVLLRNLTIGVAGHAVVVSVVLLVSVGARSSDSIMLPSFVYPLSPIFIFTAFGTLLSAFAPSVFAAVIALGLAYAVSYAAATYTIQFPINVGGLNVSMVGLEYNLQILIDFAGWAVAITAVMTLGGIGALRASRAISSASILIGILTVAIIGPSVIGASFPDRVSVTSSQIDYICAGKAPEVCLAKGHTRNLQRIVDGLSHSAAPLAEAGVDVNSLVLRDELPFRTDDGKGILLLPSSDLNKADFTREEYARALTRPTDCDEYYVDDNSAQQAALLRVSDALGTWVLQESEKGAAPSSLSPDWAHDAFEALRKCSISEEVLAPIP